MVMYGGVANLGGSPRPGQNIAALKQVNQGNVAARPAIAPPAPPQPQAQPLSVAPPQASAPADGPLNNFGNHINQGLQNPSRYDATEAKKFYEHGKTDLQQQAERAKLGALGNAASRGVYYSTAPDTMNGGVHDINERYTRGLADLTTGIAREQALTYGQDNQNAIGNAFRFGENQQQADQFRADLGLRTTNAGYAGGPNINQAIAQYGSQPISQPGPVDFSGLGALAGQFGAKKAPTSIAPKKPITGVDGPSGRPSISLG